MYNNYLKRMAILSAYQKKLLKVCPTLNNNSGIYILTRTDEDGIEYAYVGQSEHILERLATHMLGYPQHIDASLKKRGLYSQDNPYGWSVDFYNCAPEEMDKLEQEEITRLAKTHQLYNITGGSQGKGKRNIIDKTPKGYYAGVDYGYNKALKEVKNYFDKYLDFTIKGKSNKIKEKKYNEFSNLFDFKRN